MGTNRLHWPETPMLPTIRLKDKAERRLKGGHLWVYSNEVDTAATPLKGLGAGAEAVIETSAGKPLGRAVVSPEQLICARLYTRDASQPLDASFIVHRLKIALSARELWYPEQCYRWVYGDSDSLPGLVIDRFMDVVVVQISSAAMEERRQDILDASFTECLMVLLWVLIMSFMGLPLSAQELSRRTLERRLHWDALSRLKSMPNLTSFV